jgi:Icc-related predicted phosphoesterase
MDRMPRSLFLVSEVSFWLRVTLLRFFATRLRLVLLLWKAARSWWYSGELGIIFADSFDRGGSVWRAGDCAGARTCVQPAGSVRIVLISDTHGFHRRITSLPRADVLVHCGDILYDSGKMSLEDGLVALADFNEWISTFEHPWKLVIAGNHDVLLQRLGPRKVREVLSHCTYLEDEMWTSPTGLRIYATPYSLSNGPLSANCAFQSERGSDEALARVRSIPPCDVLVTHGPPEGIGDDPVVWRSHGCAALRRRVDDIAPKLHVFGHVHQAHGVAAHGRTIFVNASLTDFWTTLKNEPVVVTL